MKLIYKLTIIYLVISLIVLAIGGIFTYQDLKYEIDQEEERFLEERLQSITGFIKHKKLKHDFNKDKIAIKYLGASGMEKPITFSDTVVTHATLERPETHTMLNVTKEIYGHYYAISIYDLIVEEDDIVEGVIKSLIKTLLILLVIMISLSLLASKILLKPFEQILFAIKSFNIKDKNPVHFPSSTTRELNKLSMFLNEMTTKMKQDYHALKEFAENASHELQTPLSIASGKLELLLEDNNMSDNQLGLIVAAQNNIKRLSNMSSSLTLITKIENREFGVDTNVNISDLVKELAEEFQELIAIKSIRLEEDIEPNVLVNTNRWLLYIMVSNLIKNAINHNLNNDGMIRIELNSKMLRVENTGAPLSLKPEDLFERFKKESTKQHSLGLGLSIVKRISEINKWDINYENDDSMHRVSVHF